MLTFQSEHLRTFLAVVDCGTFDAAARQLHVTASAVSQRIKAMEQGAGQILLQRSFPIIPTAAGEVVHRLARQLGQLQADAAAELGMAGTRVTALPVVVNADSLGTWFMDALAKLPENLAVELLREDEQHSVNLLRSGAVMAAVTATELAVQGCSVTPLGSMDYRPVASAAFMRRWFPHGFSAQSFAAAPALQFDRGDTLQSRFYTSTTGQPLNGVQRYIPDTLQFAEGVRRGLGWGLVPEDQCLEDIRAGRLMELVPGKAVGVPLYWQRWKIQSAALDALSAAVVQAASAALSQAALSQTGLSQAAPR